MQKESISKTAFPIQNVAREPTKEQNILALAENPGENEQIYFLGHVFLF